MSFFKNRRLYFQNVAHNNTHIRDGENVNGHVRKSFFRINSGLELTSAVLEKAEFPCMVQWDVVVYPQQPGPYVYRKKVVNELWFLSRFNAQGSNGVASQMEDAEDEAYAAASEYIGQLIKEWEDNGNSCSYFYHIDLNGMKLELLGPVLDNTIGWRLTFEDLARGDEFNMEDEGYYPCGHDSEIIYFFDQTQVGFDWTESRRSRFGNTPIIEVWYNNATGGADVAWPSISTDANPPDQAAYTVYNGEVPKTGFIILK